MGDSAAYSVSERMIGMIQFINGILWQRLLPCLLTAAALLCGFRMRGEPVRHFGGVLRDTYGSILKRGVSGGQRRIFASALAATMGTGNLVGTALALITGGAGAIFWMWISALLGMILVYAENRLAEKYRKDGISGTISVLRFGLRSKSLSGLFAVFCTVSALGMGNAVQSNTIAETCLQYGIPQPVCGAVIAVLFAFILTGGKKRVENAALCLMPLICCVYLFGCIVLIAKHAAMLPNAFTDIFREAFGFRAAGGGFAASVMLQSLSVGIRRGIFSNEAGLGSSAMLHADGSNAQEKWAAAEVFADTVICCTATALAILTVPGLEISSFQNGTALLHAAFFSGLGDVAGGFLSASMVLFAFATMIGWFPCGMASVSYLFGERIRPLYLCCCIAAAFSGALGNPAWIWTFCDLCNGCMAIPNLTALLILHPNPEKHLTDS